MEALAHRLGISSCTVIPISALHGDNVVDALGRRTLVRRADRARRARVGPGRRLGGPARRRPRQRGPTARAVGAPPARRWPELRRHGERRAVPCRATRSSCSPGRARRPCGPSRPPTARCSEPRWACRCRVRLADHLDVSRGDLIAAAEEPPEVTDTFEATVCWFQDRPLTAGDRLRLKHTTRVTPVVVEGDHGRFDVNELRVTEASELEENDIGVRDAAHGHALGRRPVPGRPHHGQLRADRRADLRHHGGGHGRAAPRSMTEAATGPSRPSTQCRWTCRAAHAWWSAVVPWPPARPRALAECGAAVTVVAPSLGRRDGGAGAVAAVPSSAGTTAPVTLPPSGSSSRPPAIPRSTAPCTPTPRPPASG